MRTLHTALGLVVVVASLPALAGSEPSVVRHVEVYREAGRFAGWPANHGAWSWGDEILVGFEVGHFRSSDEGHAIDYDQPAEHVLARSLDGGEGPSPRAGSRQS